MLENGSLADLPGVSGMAMPRLSIVAGDMRGGNGAIFAAGSLSTRAINRIIAGFAAGGPCGLKQNLSKGWYWRGKQVPRQLAKSEFS